MGLKRIYLRHERKIWFFVIILVIAILGYYFQSNRYIRTSQTFTPSLVSTFGHPTVFNDFDLKAICNPEGNYFSEDTNLYCKIISKSIKGVPYNIKIGVKIVSAYNNQTFWNCTASISSNGGIVEREGICKSSNGDSSFELPAGDYKIDMNKFTTSGDSLVATVETGGDVIFRGTLHIMSSYEMNDKRSQDGIALATFLAFIFIIPTSILEIRHFFHEKKNKQEE